MVSKLAVFHDQPAVNDGVAHILSPGRINQMGKGVVHGRQMGFMGIDDDDVRLFARFQGTDSCGKAPNALAPSMVAIFNTVRASMTVGSMVLDLVKLGRHVHLRKQVHVVVGGGLPSVPSPHRYSPRRSFGAPGAMPELSFMLLSGL